MKINNSFFNVLTTLTLSLLTIQTANAETIDLTTQSSLSPNQQFAYSGGTISITTVLGDVAATSSGVGVDFDGSGIFDGPTLDASQSLFFSLSSTTSINSITLAFWDNPSCGICLDGDAANFVNGLQTVAFSNGVVDFGPGGIDLDNFTINGVAGSVYVQSIEISAIPIPAGLWLFGSALIGLAGIKRRTKY